jgi:hypothetical protein
MLNNGHWAYQGLYAYPFLLEYLTVTLIEVTNFFEKHNVSYTFEGGVSLGAVKMRSILPWEAGDLDIIVYRMNASQLFNMLKPWATEKGYVLRKPPGAVHVFCTPKEIGDVSGGLATIFPSLHSPPKHIRVKTNGIWVRYRRNLFQDTIRHYGEGYLAHKLYGSQNAIKCSMKGHSGCLPNFKSIFQGKGGTYREYFCKS